MENKITKLKEGFEHFGEVTQTGEELTYEDVAPIMCSHCGLDLDIHDGDGFCPPGTEEFGGRR